MFKAFVKSVHGKGHAGTDPKGWNSGARSGPEKGHGCGWHGGDPESLAWVSLPWRGGLGKQSEKGLQKHLRREGGKGRRRPEKVSGVSPYSPTGACLSVPHTSL